MKYIPLLCLILLGNIVYGQDSTSKAKYQTVHIDINGLWGGRSYATAAIYTEKDPIKVLDESGKVKRFRTSANVFEYMEEHGWQLVSAAPMDSTAWNIYCVFKWKTKE